jgi:hypothetical protein
MSVTSGCLRTHGSLRVLIAVPSPATAVGGPRLRPTARRPVHTHVTGRQEHTQALVSLIVYELWHEQDIGPSRDRLHREVFGSGGHRRVEHA